MVTDRGLADRREAWSLEFARPDGTGGFARLSRRGAQASYSAALVSPTVGLVVVRDDGLPAPRDSRLLVVRGDGLWAEFVEETRGEHWTVGLEAFGVRLDDPLDAERGERGERLPVGLRSWNGRPGIGDFRGSARRPARRSTDRLGFDGTGRFEHDSIRDEPLPRESRRLSWQSRPDDGHTARDGDVLVDVDGRGLPTAARVGPLVFFVHALVVVPVAGRLIRALVVGEAGCGWLEWCQPQPGVRPGPGVNGQDGAMFEGSVVGIFVAPAAGAPMEARDEVEAIAGTGLAGDRYADAVGTYSGHRIS